MKRSERVGTRSPLSVLLPAPLGGSSAPRCPPTPHPVPASHRCRPPAPHLTAHNGDAISYVFTGNAPPGSPPVQTPFYAEFLPTVTPTVRIATWGESGDDCVFELEAKHDGSETFELGAIDHATVNSEGLAQRMAVYTK